MSMTATNTSMNAGGTGGKSGTAGTGLTMPATSKAADPACMQLAPCCAALMDAADRDDCQRVVERDQAARCMRASSELCRMPSTGSTPTGMCVQLTSCCDKLDANLEKRQCEQAVQDARDDRCASQLERRCPELAPAPTEPACMKLQSCCLMLTDARALDACRTALRRGQSNACERESSMLCP
jgi:hypothetical protein